jgi:hypothetical protein
MKTYTIRLPDEVVEPLEEWAVAEFRSVNSLVAELLALALGVTLPRSARGFPATASDGETPPALQANRAAPQGRGR